MQLIHSKNRNLKTQGTNSLLFSKGIADSFLKVIFGGFIFLVMFFFDVSYVQVHDKIIKQFASHPPIHLHFQHYLRHSVSSQKSILSSGFSTPHIPTKNYNQYHQQLMLPEHNISQTFCYLDQFI